MFHPYSVRLFSALFQSDTNMLRQAKTIIAVLNACGIPKSCSLSSNTISIISIPSNRSTAMGKHNSETIFLSLSFTSEIEITCVQQQQQQKWCNTQNHFQYIWSEKLCLVDSMSDDSIHHCDVYNQSHNIKNTNRKEEAKVQRFEKQIQTKTAGPKKMVVRYQLELPSYLAR